MIDWTHGIDAPLCPMCKTPLTSTLDEHGQVKSEGVFLCIYCLTWLVGEENALRIMRADEVQPDDIQAKNLMRRFEDEAQQFRRKTFH